MQDFITQATKRLPEINFNASSGILNIKGVFIQGTDPSFLELYNQLYDWLKKYVALPVKKTVLNLEFEIISTSAGKPLLYILKIMEDMYLAGYDVSINWFYKRDAEDLYEDGEDYKSVLRVPINLVEI